MRDNQLCFGTTSECKAYLEEISGQKPTQTFAKPETEIREAAVNSVRTQGGDIGNQTNVLGAYQVQFGKFKGKTFKWLTENSLGYAAWLVDNMRHETAASSALGQNKHSFKRYLLSFPEGKEAVDRKAKEREAKTVSAKPATTTPPKAATTAPKASALAAINFDRPTQAIVSKIGQVMHPNRPKPNIVPRVTSTRTTCTTTPSAASPSKSGQEIPDDVLVSHVTAVEKALTQHPTLSLRAPQDFPLPDGWKQTLPEADRKWVAAAAFKWSSKGKPELDMSKIESLWLHPPSPPLVQTQVPKVDRYFAQRLFVWMPKKLWRVKLHCPHEECEKNELTGAGIYPRLRQVLDLDGYYAMAAEYLECSRCKRKVISWSNVIVQQLDIGHRMQFPAIVTYR